MEEKKFCPLLLMSIPKGASEELNE